MIVMNLKNSISVPQVFNYVLETLLNPLSAVLAAYMTITQYVMMIFVPQVAN